MGMTSQITIGDSTYCVEDLLAQTENGTLYNYLEHELNKLSGEAEANQLLEDVSESIEKLKVDYENMIEGAEEDQDDLIKDKDSDLYDIHYERYEEEIDELEELIGDLDSTLYMEIQDCVNEYSKNHVRTDADIKFTPTIDYENGDVVEVQATGGKAASSDDDYDGEDFDGNGVANYQDYAAYLESKSLNDLEGDCQGIFVYLEPEDVVQNMTYVNGTITVDIYNSRNGNNVTMNISGIMNDANLYFEYGNASSLPSSVYSHLPSEIKKYMYVNEEVYSLYEQSLDRSDEDKLTFIDRYDEIKEGAAEVTAEYATNPDAALPYVEQGLEIMFSYLNYESGNTTSLAEVMASYLDVLDEIMASQLKSDVLVSFVMTMAKKAGQSYFQGLLGQTIPALIEEIFLEDGDLSNNEMVACLLLETQTGETVGKFGGTEMLSVDTATQTSDSGTTQSSGALFYLDENGRLESHDEHWQKFRKLSAAMRAYQELTLEIGWTANTGVIDEFMGHIENREAYLDKPKVAGEYQQVFNMAQAQFVQRSGSNSGTGPCFQSMTNFFDTLVNLERATMDDLVLLFRNFVAEIANTNEGKMALAVVIRCLTFSPIGSMFLRELHTTDSTLLSEIKKQLVAYTPSTTSPHYDFQCAMNTINDIMG